MSTITKQYKVVAIGAVIVAICLLPLIFGWIAKNQMVNAFEHLPPSWELEVHLDDYRLGWFHSSAVYSVISQNKVLQTAYAQYQETQGISEPAPLVLQLNQQINHGPFLVNESELFESIHLHFGIALVRGNVILQEQSYELLKPFLEQKILLEGVTQIGFRGHWDTTFRAKKIRFSDKTKKMEGFISGIHSKLKVNPHAKKIDGVTEIDKILVKISDKTLTLDGLKMKFDYQKTDFWEGATAVMLPFVMITESERVRLIINEFRMEMNQFLQSETVTLEWKADLDNIVLEQKNFGPGSYQITLKNLGTDIFANCCEQFFADNGFLRGAKKVRQDFLATLISHGFQLSINPFFLETPDGDLSLQAWVTLPDFSTHQPTNVEQLIRGADGSIVLILPRARIQQAMQLLHESFEGMSQPQFIAIKKWLLNDLQDNSKADPYSLSVAYKAGKIFINGALIETAPESELNGTGGRTRTDTMSPPPDFESGASTSFATPAPRGEL